MLHDWTVGLLQSGRTYDRSYRAAFEYPTRARLPGLQRPALITAGPSDMLVDALREAAGLCGPQVEIAPTPATLAADRVTRPSVERQRVGPAGACNPASAAPVA